MIDLSFITQKKKPLCCILDLKLTQRPHVEGLPGAVEVVGPSETIGVLP